MKPSKGQMLISTLRLPSFHSKTLTLSSKVPNKAPYRWLVKFAYNYIPQISSILQYKELSVFCRARSSTIMVPLPISILTSAWIFFRSQVKRIVFTSSSAAVDSYELYPLPPGTIYTENKWNERSIQLLEAEKTGKEKLSYYSFQPISKTMAEKGDIFSTPLSIYY